LKQVLATGLQDMSANCRNLGASAELSSMRAT
jgi:hypothetical protein